MDYVRILVYSNDLLLDKVWILLGRVIDNAMLHVEKRDRSCEGDFDVTGFEIVSHKDVASHPEGNQTPQKRRTKFCFTLNALELSYFMINLHSSMQYRYLVVKNFCDRVRQNNASCCRSTLSISIVDPPKQVIDFMWCHRITFLVMERSELDNAMSWLSTLGGAYSALGDHFSFCAEMAGRISLKQFALALRLGDPNTVVRCKLYIALSFIQTNKFKAAQRLIEQQYHMVNNSKCADIRLIRMCRGIWSKLRYERSRYIEKKRKQRAKRSTIDGT